MHDDWRLLVRFEHQGLVRSAMVRLSASELQHDLETSFHDRVIVSADGPEVFCYGGSRDQLERAQDLIAREAADHGWRVSYELTRWHPGSQQWQPADQPLPVDEQQSAAERAALIAQERAESERLGTPEYEVRVTCPTRERATELARKLREEG